MTVYARAVAKGKIVAGPYVRDACKRHLEDIKTGAARGLVWDAKRAQLEIDFFEEVLHLNGGDFEGQLFKLHGWQAFIVGSLSGWRRADGFRRFNLAYVETGKGSGKSPLAAGVGIRGLTGKRQRAEIYSAATKKDQAMVLFRDAVAMVKQSPLLASRCATSGAVGKEYNIAYHKQHSFFRPISSDEGQSGPRPHIGLIDELHEHKDSVTVEMMKAGFKNDRDALLFIITNSGVGQTSVCWNYHDYAVKVSRGDLQDDSFFGYVCGLDEGDDPFTDESCWIKANPSLPELPGMDYLRGQFTAARGMPSKASVVKRLNFCIWTDAGSPWLSYEVWKKARTEVELEALRGRRCFGGLDMSSTTDVTAFVLAFEPIADGEPWLLVPWFWLPGDDLHERDDRDRVPYAAWRDQGYLRTKPGKAIRPAQVAADVAEICAMFDVVSIGYDRWGIEALKVAMENDGISLPLVPHGQGFKDMAPAVKEFEARLLNGQLKHGGHPILTAHASAAVLDEDPAGNRKPVKQKATGRIDGIVAALMAIGQTLTPEEDDGDVDDFINKPVVISL